MHPSIMDEDESHIIQNYKEIPYYKMVGVVPAIFSDIVHRLFTKMTKCENKRSVMYSV